MAARGWWLKMPGEPTNDRDRYFAWYDDRREVHRIFERNPNFAGHAVFGQRCETGDRTSNDRGTIYVFSSIPTSRRLRQLIERRGGTQNTSAVEYWRRGRAIRIFENGDWETLRRGDG
jgi:hypothetical protein